MQEITSTTRVGILCSFLNKQFLFNLAFNLALFLNCSVLLAADEESINRTEIVSWQHVLNWVIGLVIVLSLFFICIWVLRKIGGFTLPARENMKIISGLSLGAREKLVLVQIGKKQLVLAVMPGKIEKILLLEGDEQLFKSEPEVMTESEITSKVTRFMEGSSHE